VKKEKTYQKIILSKNQDIINIKENEEKKKHYEKRRNKTSLGRKKNNTE
jgi:hypothetical protein